MFIEIPEEIEKAPPIYSMIPLLKKLCPILGWILFGGWLQGSYGQEPNMDKQWSSLVAIVILIGLAYIFAEKDSNEQ